ncbi:MAG TPA: hypothetical protein VGQ67_06105 [Candidatus Polarisedimenticolia bacterium]|jgi:hypothetical protein|nr:hypothetical protein [Candidatus Polarisedimenticolia bacterium]
MTAACRVCRAILAGVLAVGVIGLAGVGVARAESAAATPPNLVSSYQTLADAILAVKKTESNLVRAILEAAHMRAESDVNRARAALKANDAKGAQAAIESAAAAVSQIASEGDASVGSVRKRLLEGGHHHNAEGEQKGTYDPGFVIVTKAAKQQLLDAAKALGQTALAPKADALEAAWTRVETAWSGLMK